MDSNAAKAIASRLGLWRVRHMEVKCLWAQEALRQKRFEVAKVLGKKNPADVLTKPLGATGMQGIWRRLLIPPLGRKQPFSVGGVPGWVVLGGDPSPKN